MRITLACPYAIDAPGGVQVHVKQLAKRLGAMGHAVQVLAPAFGPGVEEPVEVVGRPVPVPFNGSIAPICPDPRSLHRIRAALHRFAPDIVHAHEPLAPSTAMFSTLVAGTPVVATFHANAERSLALSAGAPLLGPVWRRLAVRLAVSEAAARFVRRRFRGEVRVIPNGVDVHLFREATPAPLPPGRAMLFVNRLERRKGLAVAVDALPLVLAAFPEALLVVAGDGPERRVVDALRPELRDRVVMLGSVPHDALPPYHHASDVFVAPATGGESFGIVLVEAMAAGLPVIASDIAGYREVVRRGVDGLLVPPGDPVRLAAGVIRVLGETGLAARLRKQGPERAERFSWPVVATSIVAAYADALREWSGPRLPS